jgi:hydroxymethylglutaryl-CoA reductase
MTNVRALSVPRSSRLSEFSRLTPKERRSRLVDARWLAPQDVPALSSLAGFDEAQADAMVENVVGLHALPLGVATNFQVDGVDRLVPMAVEEPSIVAACSFAARLVREGGGFTANADPPLLAAQVQLLDVPDEGRAIEAIRGAQAELLELADRQVPRMKERGGGAREIEVRILEPGMLCVHLLVDCRDAMGANTVNTVAEGVAPRLAELSGGRYGLRILTNLSDRRKVEIKVRVPAKALASKGFEDGEKVRDGIVAAQRFAELDPYRAATHNKGIMNGVDAVLLACGNDWRAVEAGAHAFASKGGSYQPLTRWRQAEDGALEGTLVMPLAASTVGGAARNHPGVKLALRMAGVESAQDLAVLAACAGLAANLAALRALSTEGIQKGHMALHARRVAAEAGAEGELIDLVAAQLSREKAYRPERAAQILVEFQRQRRQAGVAP